MIEGLRRKFVEKVRWHTNEFLVRRPGLIAKLGLPLTVEDGFGTVGDTLLTGIVCRELKKKHPALRIHCKTPNPALLKGDPDIQVLNGKPTWCSIRFWYLDLIDTKDSETNVLKPTLQKLGIKSYDYRARIYLSGEELAAARARLVSLGRPIVTINIASRERVKEWPLDLWRALAAQLAEFATVVQLGDDREPIIGDVVRFAGQLSLRESAAVLAHAAVHIGPDSFLMHAANAVDVPAVIIYGGARPPACLAYGMNTNLFVRIECSPCWLHDSRGDRCPHEIKCMRMISPQQVLEAVREKLARRAA